MSACPCGRGKPNNTPVVTCGGVLFTCVDCAHEWDNRLARMRRAFDLSDKEWASPPAPAGETNSEPHREEPPDDN